MKAIQDTNPADLVAEATHQLIEERRHGASTAIKQILIRQEQLTQKINAGENQLKKDRESLEKGRARIERLKAGDWSVLTDEAKDQQGNAKPQTEAAE